MDIRKVKILIEMLEESEISEIEIHEGEESVRISRHSSNVPAQTVVQVPGGAEIKPATSTVTTGQVPAGTEQEMAGYVIKAPMVGIFYEAGSPDSPPFVEKGQSVSKGDVICIIEAMKIMNQIESDESGVISKVFVENGEPVEYGQPLFLIT